jgi:hypothetical protein
MQNLLEYFIIFNKIFDSFLFFIYLKGTKKYIIINF